MAIPIDDLVVPEGFRMELVSGAERYNAQILTVPGFNLKKPVEIHVGPGGREGVLLADIRIPVGYFVSGFGGSNEQAAYRLFKQMDDIRNNRKPGHWFSPSDLETLAGYYESV
ncbi:MAG: hypothetical protein WCV90_05755 [Candidatus Woesearchaeota archaeon]|jgi:hypothetical protein